MMAQVFIVGGQGNTNITQCDEIGYIQRGLSLEKYFNGLSRV